MRTLEFRVHGQEIAQAAGCDFDGLVRGTKGYLRARFYFDENWDGCRVAASFYDAQGNEHAAAVVNSACMIPDEALAGGSFSVSLTGVKRGYRITAGKLTIRQGG